jgi:hypothetical protein
MGSDTDGRRCWVSIAFSAARRTDRREAGGDLTNWGPFPFGDSGDKLICDTAPVANSAADRDNAALAHQLAEAARTEIDPWPTWPGGWPNEADTALIDAVFSTRARYETVVRPLLGRWHDSGLGSGHLSSLLACGPDKLAEVLKNRQLVPGRSHNRPTKVEAVLDVAARMVEAQLDTPEEIRAAAAGDHTYVRRLIQGTSGVGPAQSSYFLMLLGVSGVKADTMVTRWVERTLTLGSLPPEKVEALVVAAAKVLKKSATDLDHAIWRTESTSRRR